jgi:hypothetical protein
MRMNLLPFLLRAATSQHGPPDQDTYVANMYHAVAMRNTPCPESCQWVPLPCIGLSYFLQPSKRSRYRREKVIHFQSGKNTVIVGTVLSESTVARDRICTFRPKTGYDANDYRSILEARTIDATVDSPREERCSRMAGIEL